MTKTFCDRCGKEIKEKDHLGVYAWITHKCCYAKLRMTTYDNLFVSDDKYICPECENSYISWFMNPEKDE